MTANNMSLLLAYHKPNPRGAGVGKFQCLFGYLTNSREQKQFIEWSQAVDFFPHQKFDNTRFINNPIVFKDKLTTKYTWMHPITGFHRCYRVGYFLPYFDFLLQGSNWRPRRLIEIFTTCRLRANNKLSFTVPYNINTFAIVETKKTKTGAIE